ncbi:hypothetical protein OHA77_31070 [Streptosporangium sp. NBC_01639]|uniref:hypothetical protein n=1 Tax=Streptosporangium sp. NBC_01639 TaxID=2975948 RepID=UPI00386DA453|nr:hypothetical protein OHA77_31070 [Streptosporangium sp. NBC_01639]
MASIPAPDGDHFPTQRELIALLADAGCKQIEQPSQTPLSWSRRAQQVAAPAGSGGRRDRHRAHPAYELVAHQDARFTRLFAAGQISVQPIHVAGRTSTQTTYGGMMSTPSGENDSLHELEVEIKAEVTLAESSHPEEFASLSVTEWLFDPTDVEREEIGLRGLLDAVEVLEDGSRPDDHAA